MLNDDTSSTPVVISSFEEALKELNSVIQSVASGASENSFAEELPRFATSSSQFMRAFNRIKDEPEAVENTQNVFYETLRRFENDITSKVFDEDEQLNDNWIRNDECDAPREKSKKKSSGKISLSHLAYRGIAVYVDRSNPALRNVCLPLTEAYLTATEIYQRETQKKRISYMPYKLLKTIYECFYFAIPDSRESVKRSVKKNITYLKQFIETGVDESSSSKGTVFDGITKMVGKLTSSNFDLSKIKNMVNGVISSENQDKFTQVFNTFSENVQSSNGDIVSGIKKSLEAPEVTELMGRSRELISQAQNLLGGASATVSEVSNESAGDQE